MWTISLPLRVSIGKTKYFVLNLNQYRNEQFFNLNKSKIEFKRLITPLLKDIPRLEGCTLEYVLFPGSARSCDVANVCSIQDKYFSDALVEAGLMEDDNYEFVPEVHYRFGQIDRLNPRVEVTITPMKTKTQGNNMRITLNEVEIKEAIRLFVLDQITINDDQQVEIDLNATRGPEGYTAIIDITAPQVEAEAPVEAETPVVRRRGRPAGSVNKPKAEPAPAVEAAPEASESVADPIAESVKEFGTATLVNKTEAALDAAEAGEVTQVQAGETLAESLSTDVAETEIQDDSKLATSQEEVTNFVQREEAPVPTAEPAGGSSEPVSPTPRQSLFSGLSRPVNN